MQIGTAADRVTLSRFLYNLSSLFRLLEHRNGEWKASCGLTIRNSFGKDCLKSVYNPSLILAHFTPRSQTDFIVFWIGT